MEKLFEEAAQSADVLDTAQNNTLSAQPDAGAQSAAAFAQNNTLSAQPDAGAQSAAVFKTAPFQVAQSTDLFYTEKKSAQPDAGAQSAAAQNNFPVAQPTDPPYTAPRVSQAPTAQELGSQFSKLTIDSLTRAPRKTTAAQELEIAAREPATATHREEALLLLMQELRDALKQSSLVAPTQHLANSVVASSIGPNDSASMIGSQNSQNNTVLAQAVNTQDAHHNRTHNAGRQPMFQQPNTGAARHFGTVALLPLHGDAW
jgi:hypothetical protein